MTKIKESRSSAETRRDGFASGIKLIFQKHKAAKPISIVAVVTLAATLLGIAADWKSIFFDESNLDMDVNGSYLYSGVLVNDDGIYQNIDGSGRQVAAGTYQENVVNNYFSRSENSEPTTTEGREKVDNHNDSLFPMEYRREPVPIAYELTVPQMAILLDYSGCTITRTASTVSMWNEYGQYIPMGFEYMRSAYFNTNDAGSKQHYYVKSLRIDNYDDEFQIASIQANAYIMVQYKGSSFNAQEKNALIPVLHYWDKDYLGASNGLIQGELSSYAVPLDAICCELEFENYNIPNRWFRNRNDGQLLQQHRYYIEHPQDLESKVFYEKFDPGVAMILQDTWKFCPFYVYEISYEDTEGKRMSMWFYDAAEFGVDRLSVKYDDDDLAPAEKVVFSEIINLPSYSAMEVHYLVPLFDNFASLPVLSPVDCANVSACWGEASLEEANPWVEKVWEELVDIMK